MDVEGSFSKYKNVLSDDYRSFNFDIKYALIIQCNNVKYLICKQVCKIL